MTRIERKKPATPPKKETVKANRQQSAEKEVVDTGVKRTEKGTFAKGSKPLNGFDKRPEDRNAAGGWDKNQTISYQYNLFLRMSHDEFKQWQDKHPTSERTMAQEIAYQRMSELLSGKVKTSEKIYGTDKIQDRTEGKAPVIAQVNVSENDAMSQLGVEELRALANITETINKKTATKKRK